MERRKYDYDDFKEVQELVEEYRRNSSNYGRRFHKTRLNESYESSNDRVQLYMEELSADAYIDEEIEEE